VKKYFFIIFFILGIHQMAVAEQRGVWTIWRSDGKGDTAYSYKQKPQTTVLENYEYNVLQLHPDLAWIKEHEKKETFSLKPSVTVVGKWNGFEVYDVFEENYGLKQIIVKLQEGEYKILYSLWPADAETELEPSIIESAETGQKLITKIRLPGKNGGYYHEEFVMDPSTKRIVNLMRKNK
jgi:hypothetical protein